MVAYVQNTAGAQSVATNFTPNGVPGAGDTIDKNGFPLLLDVPGPLGIDDGSAPVFDSVQFPAGAKAAPAMVQPGITIQLAGRIGNSNGDFQVAPGAVVQYTNSDDQIQDHGDFDNDGAASPGILMGAGSALEYIGTGGSMSLRVDGGGCLDIQGGLVDGFGSPTSPALDARIDSDPAQSFIAKNCWFTRSRNRLDLKFWGDGTMGNIDIDVLGNIAPQAGGGDIHCDGNDDTVLHTTANVRSIKGLRAEGDLQLRYMQGYTSGRDIRLTGSPLTVPGSADCADLLGWFVGNNNGSFMLAIGSHKDSIFRDVADNPHAIAINQLRDTDPVLSGNVFLMDGAQDSSDTGDCFATNSSNAATDFTVAGQVIELSDNLVVARFSNGGRAINADEHSSAGATPSDTIIEHKRNIWSNHDGQAPSTIGVMLRGLLGAADDVVTLGQSDENVFHLFPDGLGLKESTLGVNDLNTSSQPPQFVDASRNLAAWAQYCAGGVSEAEAVVNLVRAGFPGYGAVPAVDGAVYDLDALRLWLRAGHIDRNPAHAGRGITDTDTGVEAAGIDTPGSMQVVEGDAHDLILSMAGIALTMEIHDSAGNVQAVTLGTKPGAAVESFTLPDKGSLVFGGPEGFRLVVKF